MAYGTSTVNLKLALPLLYVLVLSPFCYGHEKTIYVPEFKSFISGGEPGPYYLVLNEILKRSKLRVKTEVLPFARAIALFERNEESCFFGASQKSAYDYLGKSFIDGEYFNHYKIGLAVRKGSKLKQLTELKGHHIAVILGDRVEAFGLNEDDYTLHYVGSYDQSVEMLRLGRVDAIAGSLADLKPHISDLTFDINSVVYESPESFACHKNQHSTVFLTKVSKSIRDMKEDGTLKMLLGDYYLLEEL